MRLTHAIRERVGRLLSTPGEELGHWARLLRFQIDVARVCVKRLREDNAMAMSSALSFRTIFALVPVLVLALLMLNSFKAFGDRQQHVGRFLEFTGLTEIRLEWDGREASSRPDGQAVTQQVTPAAPTQRAAEPGASGDRPQPTLAEDEPPASRRRPEQVNLGELIERTIERVEKKLTIGRVGPVGALLLIWTALTLLTTIERSLNRIFGARRGRGIARSLMLYWSVVTLGPIVAAAVTWATRSAAGAVGENLAAAWIVTRAWWLVSVLVGIFLLALLYKLMPTAQVALRSALYGAAIAVPLWLVAKWGLGIYIRFVVAGGSLYGVLGLLPLMLFWLNTSWLIFLFGAELAFAAGNLKTIQDQQRVREESYEPGDLLAAAVAVAQPFEDGAGAVALGEVSSRLNLRDDLAQRLLERLAEWGMVCPVEDGARYILARAPQRISVPAVLHVHPSPGRQPPRRYGDAAMDAALTRARARMQDSLGEWTLADLIAPGDQA